MGAMGYHSLVLPPAEINTPLRYVPSLVTSNVIVHNNLTICKTIVIVVGDPT